MNKVENRETFLSLADVLLRLARQCSVAEAYLREHLGEVDEPYVLALKRIADAEHKLANGFEQYVENGPKSVLDTRVQYILEEDFDFLPDTVGQALKNLVEVNRKLAEQLGDLGEKLAPEHESDIVSLLRTEVDAVNRQISIIRLTVQDV